MITQEEARALVGKRVALSFTAASGERDVEGRCAGKIESVDGLALVVEPDGGGPRRTYHHQHIERARVIG